MVLPSGNALPLLGFDVGRAPVGRDRVRPFPVEVAGVPAVLRAGKPDFAEYYARLNEGVARVRARFVV